MPHNGITYRGKHSDEFGTIVKTVGRPIIAPVKQVDEEVAYRDGNVDYSEAGGRLYYEDKVLELEFTIRAMNTTELHKKVSRMINWAQRRLRRAYIRRYARGRVDRKAGRS